uniref:Uncharacterized protein n=1 Tax=Arundo donax TaxID=35708 RepID=A0A0A8ZVM1_ARUDO
MMHFPYSAERLPITAWNACAPRSLRS